MRPPPPVSAVINILENLFGPVSFAEAYLSTVILASVEYSAALTKICIIFMIAVEKSSQSFCQFKMCVFMRANINIPITLLCMAPYIYAKRRNRPRILFNSYIMFYSSQN